MSGITTVGAANAVFHILHWLGFRPSAGHARDCDRLAGDAVVLLAQLAARKLQLSAPEAEIREAFAAHCAGSSPELDGAMHSIWLHGKWRWLTRNMTTAEREAAAAAVERVWAQADDSDGEGMSEATRAALRWWR